MQPVGRWALGHHRWAVWEKFKTQRLARDCLPFVWQVQHSVHLECRFRGRRSTRGVSRWQVLLVLFHAVEPATRFMLLQFPQECACPNSPAQQGGFSLAGVTLVLLHAGARATCFMLLGVPSKTAQNWCVQSAQLHVAVLFLRRLQTCVMIFTSFAFSQTIFSLNVMRAQSWLCKHTRHSAHFWLEDGFEVAGGG